MKKSKKNKNLWLKETEIEVGYLYFTTANQYRAVLAIKGFPLKPGQLPKTMGYERPVLCLFLAAEVRPFQPPTMKTNQETFGQINALSPLFRQPV